MVRPWQDIPESILRDEQAMLDADNWAKQQRAQLAGEWAQTQLANFQQWIRQQSAQSGLGLPSAAEVRQAGNRGSLRPRQSAGMGDLRAAERGGTTMQERAALAPSIQTEGQPIDFARGAAENEYYRQNLPGYAGAADTAGYAAEMADRPRNALMSAAYQSTQEAGVPQSIDVESMPDLGAAGQRVLEAGRQGLTGERHTMAADVLKGAGVQNETIANVLGFGLDLVADPVNYIPGAALTKPGRAAIGATGRAVSRGAQVAGDVVGRGVRAVEEAATGPAVRRLAPGLTVQDVSRQGRFSDLQIGAEDFIRDTGTGQVGIVTGEGTLAAGKQQLPAWRVLTADGGETLILKSDAQMVSPSQSNLQRAVQGGWAPTVPTTPGRPTGQITGQAQLPQPRTQGTQPGAMGATVGATTQPQPMVGRSGTATTAAGPQGTGQAATPPPSRTGGMTPTTQGPAVTSGGSRLQLQTQQSSTAATATARAVPPRSGQAPTTAAQQLPTQTATRTQTQPVTGTTRTVPSSSQSPPSNIIPGKTASGSNVVGPTRTAGFREFWDRTRNVIAHQGPAGQQLANDLQRSRDLAETMAGDWVNRMPTVRKLTPEEFDDFVTLAEGGNAPSNPKITQALVEWDTVRNEAWNAANNAGVVIGKQQNYFPHVFDEKVFSNPKTWNDNIQHLINTGQAATTAEAEQMLRRAHDVVRNRRYGNLEAARLVDLPGYQRSADVLFGYIENAARRISQASVFGAQDEKALALITKMGEQGFDANAAKHAFDVASGAKTYGTKLSAASNVARTYNAITKLGLSALSNAGQTVNTATVTGGIRALTATKEAIFNPQASEYALKIGATLDGVINDLREGGGWAGKLGKITAPGFSTVEKFNRTVAAHAGRQFARDMAQDAVKGSRSAIEELTKMGLDPQAIIQRGGRLLPEDEVKAARNIVERTQFKVDPQDLPVWASSPLGKMVMQFRTFSYNQSAFMTREVITPALKGNAGPLIRFLIFGGPTGLAVTEIRNFIQARPSEENWTKRIEQYYQRVGGLGILGDLVTAFFPMNSQYLDPNRYATMAIGSVVGPSFGTAAEFLGAAAGAVQGNPTNLERFALRQIPGVGTTLQNLILPYKTNDSTLTPLQKRLQSSGGGGLTPLQKRLQKAGAGG
jgi:hypothetical protein